MSSKTKKLTFAQKVTLPKVVVSLGFGNGANGVAKLCLHVGANRL